MRQLKNNSKIELLGSAYKISFQKKKFIKPTVARDGYYLKVFRSELTKDGHKQILSKWLKDRSRKYLTKRVETLAKNRGFEFNRIAIRDQKTRWGSCSSKRNLNFNWKLILTPKSCIDYVILHELSHTKQMNHSKNFWSLVEQQMPGYKRWEQWLQEEGKNLF